MAEFTRLSDAYPHMVDERKPRKEYRTPEKRYEPVKIISSYDDRDRIEPMLEHLKIQQQQHKLSTEQKMNSVHEELKFIKENMGKVIAGGPKKTGKTVAVVSPPTATAGDYYHPFWSDPTSVILIKVLIIISIIVLFIAAFGAIFYWVAAVTKSKSN